MYTMHFILQKDSILIVTRRGLYICPKMDEILKVIAKGRSYPSIIHNYQNKAMLDFKIMSTWVTELRIEVNPPTITGYTLNGWVYSDVTPNTWVEDPNYSKHVPISFRINPVRKVVDDLPYTL